jgi:hypothetical protein
MIKVLVASVILLLAFGWAWLFLSSTGLLIRSELLPVSPATLRCTYFVGTGFDTRDFWRDIVGICPRLYRYGGG